MDFTETYTDTVSKVSAAARAGCTTKLKKLILRGFRVDTSRDNRGWSALHEAAAAGSEGCLSSFCFLSAAGSSRSFVNSLTHEGESACYLAARRGHLAVVRLLLSAHADINQLTNDLSCPLYTAVDGGHTEVVALLLSKGSKVNGTHTASCWTCLHQAVYKGHSDIVRLLVTVSDLEAPDDHDITPLFVAAQYGQRESLEILVNAGANVSAQAADLATPLMIASQEGHVACVDFLLDHGADPNTACSLDWPQLPLHAAAEFGHIRVLKRLIAVTDRVCDHGEGAVSPLYVAVYRDQSRSVEVLLEGGYSPDAQDCTHILGVQSPLSLALSRSADKPRISQTLRGGGPELDHQEKTLRGGSPDLDHQGKTVLQLQELQELLCVALNQVHFAACWLPLLLKAGTDEPRVNVLQYSLPPLSHLCRLKVRSVLGPDVLMTTDVVQQLPVPTSLHGFLQFKDIPETEQKQSERETSKAVSQL
uniref:Ankyrin repeat and SOCS box containing 3 n=1 Tax=Labrus bergylta TaxID=56723 RepID=A0A3Q3GTP1_9LABR